MKSLSLSTVNKPVNVFKACPKCGTKELIAVDGDVICTSCSWDSIALYADALFDQQMGPMFRKQVQNETDATVVQLGSVCPEISIVA